MKKEYSVSFISDIISMAWADDISFDKIRKDSGLSEPEVIKIMRSNLKPGSFKLWRKRVSGRNSKHDKKIKSYHIVRNNKSINFTSKLKADDTFRVSFKIDYVKPISSALLSENITIYAHENKPLIFSIAMDKNTMELKILTEIIDDRNQM